MSSMFSKGTHNFFTDFKLDRDWLLTIVFLLIPGLRLIGAFMLAKKIRLLARARNKNPLPYYILALYLVFGGFREIIGGITVSIIPLTVVVLAIAGLIGWQRSRDDRYDNYVSCLGDHASYSMDALMSEMGVDEKRLRQDIAAMKKKKLLPSSAYVDAGRRVLVIRPEGKPQAEAAPFAKEDEKEMSEEERQYREILLEIRALNVAIDDETVSRKIDHIEEVTANIFHIVRQQPEYRPDIQTFMEYYLPTTLKLLRQYARLEHQPVSGENIAASRARIEAVLDKLTAGFDKQLDLLFKSEAIDITNDVKVLEKMMQMDGLSPR